MEYKTIYCVLCLNLTYLLDILLNLKTIGLKLIFSFHRNIRKYPIF